MDIVINAFENVFNGALIVSGFVKCRRFPRYTTFIHLFWILYLTSITIAGIIDVLEDHNMTKYLYFATRLLLNFCVFLSLLYVHKSSVSKKFTEDHLGEWDLLMEQHLSVNVNDFFQMAHIKWTLIVMPIIVYIPIILNIMFNGDRSLELTLRTVACRLQFLHLIQRILIFEPRLRAIKLALQNLMAENKSIKSKIWLRYTNAEYQRLNALRYFYGKLFELRKEFNESINPILFINIMTMFFYIITNINRCFSVTTRLYFPGVLLNTLAVYITVYMIFLRAHKLCLIGYYIGSHMHKLVKPFGNNVFNDMVMEFQLQVIHQSFTLNVFDIFELNLNVFVSMTAVTLTYLGITLQFLFTDEEHVPFQNLIP